jgi:Mg-chelatase subunit ChlD
MVLVIDVTGSMQEEMLGTQEALIAFVKQRDATQFPLSALIVFRDEVTVTAVTKDMNMLIDAIEDMEVSGGGMCPEASAEALEVAIRHVKWAALLY